MTNPEIKNPRAKHDFIGRTCSISAVGFLRAGKSADQR